MMSTPKITFIGAGSTIFVRSILGDVFRRGVLKMAHTALMDIDPTCLEGPYIVVHKLMDSAGVSDKITCHTQQEEALWDTSFVAVAFQIGGYEPCTATDFEVCKRHGLEQTITDTLESGGIIHTLRIIPHLWQIYEDMMEVRPNTAMLNYVNPMAMDIWAMYARYPHIKQVGLCHLVWETAEEPAHDLNIDSTTLRYYYTGIGHVAFYLELERKTIDDSYTNLYPELLAAYRAGQAPELNVRGNTCCQNIVRHEMFKKLSYFIAELSEYFAEYTPWLIKPGREDLIGRYKISLGEYPKRCVEQLTNWHKKLEKYKNASRIDIKPPREYASTVMNVIWTSKPNVIYSNIRNNGLIDNLPQGCCVEAVYLVDVNGIQPAKTGTLPSHPVALMQTNINVQTLLTEAVLTEDRDRVYHVAMMGLHITVVLGIDEIYALVDDPITARGDWLPG